MSAIRNSLILFLSITAFGADKGTFKPGPADSYPNKQTNSGLTIAAVPYESDEQARTAFGKVNPYKYGVLPVLVVMRNDSGQTMKLDDMQVEYVAQNRTRIEATPPGDVKYIAGGQRPKIGQSPLPTGGPRISIKKNPLAAFEIESRAFSAKMLPPSESASGFFYFQTGTRPGAKLYVTGIKEAASGKEIFYFEIPLER